MPVCCAMKVNSSLAAPAYAMATIESPRVDANWCRFCLTLACTARPAFTIFCNLWHKIFSVGYDAAGLHNFLQFFSSVILAPAVNFKSSVSFSCQVDLSDSAGEAN
jgi:hypothetical protein